MESVNIMERVNHHMTKYPTNLVKNKDGSYSIPGGLDIEVEGDDFIIDENHNHYWKDEAISEETIIKEIQLSKNKNEKEL